VAETFAYTSYYPDTSAADITATYDPENDNAVSEAHIDNGWPADGQFAVLQQFSATDPARPEEWDDNGVVVYGPITAPAGVVTDEDLSGLGLRFATELSAYYGDEYLTATGGGAIVLAGGEIQLALLE
jgi:hypothetical protein